MRILTCILVLLALGTTTPVTNAQRETNDHPILDTCHLKKGLEGVPLGVAYYFRDVMNDVIRVLELPEGSDWDVETHGDFLCWTPRSAQPILIATAEHLIYLIVEVVPHMAWISMQESAMQEAARQQAVAR